MRFEQLPSTTRVKLDGQQEQRLWNRVDEVGIPVAASKTDYSCTSIYNWRSKEVFLPVDFISEFIEIEKVEALKGRGRSVPMENVEFPLKISNELLTRVQVSVKANKEGVPMYQSTERSLLDRFAALLDDLGAPYSVYNRSVYELRYPKYLHDIFEAEKYEEEFAALVDEEGKIENGVLKARGEEVPVQDFNGKLHSRDKKLELALQRDDEEKIREIMVEEAGKVREALQP